MVFGRKKSLSKGSTTAASVESFADFVRARARRDGIVLSAPVEKELARALGRALKAAASAEYHSPDMCFDMPVNAPAPMPCHGPRAR